MKVLLTGAAGFIGSAVRTRLEGAGHEVVALDAFIPQAHAGSAGDDSRGVLRVDVRSPEQIVSLLDI